MSTNKYTSRGFGASGASQSSWQAPRADYKTSQNSGSSFLFGGAGLRGSPKSGAQQRPLPTGAPTERSSSAAQAFDQGSVPPKSKGEAKDKRGIDVAGGDITTTKLERTMILVGLFLAALVFSALIRACAVSTDSSWVREHRSHINPGDS